MGISMNAINRRDKGMDELKSGEHDVQLEITPHGRASKVVIDGQDISRHIYHVTVEADAMDVTRVTLYGYKTTGEPIKVTGRMLLENEDDPDYEVRVSRECVRKDGREYVVRYDTRFGAQYHQYKYEPKGGATDGA